MGVNGGGEGVGGGGERWPVVGLRASNGNVGPEERTSSSSK